MENRKQSEPFLDTIDFKEVVDHLDVGVYVADPEGMTLYVNTAYSEAMGVPQSHFIGRRVQDLVKENAHFSTGAVPKVIKSRRVERVTSPIYSAKAKMKGAHATGVPVFEEDGSFRGVVVTVNDTAKLHRYYRDFLNSLEEKSPVRIEPSERSGGSGYMIGSCPQLQKIQKTMDAIADTDATVLITGESGTGKETVADRIQAASTRRGQPYVKINCAAIPKDLLEAELFGYEKGAFTGASAKGKAGLLELANRGTVLLDEVGELPLELQPKLLRALQQQEVYRVGGSEPIQLDIRIIASTNADLKLMVQNGNFREDLYYRLNVIPISVPPLRERVGDIRNLASFFFHQACIKHNRSLELTDEFLHILELYRWPGNVRELQNIIEYFVICLDEQGELDVASLRNLLKPDLSTAGAAPKKDSDFYQQVADFEKNLIEQAFQQAGSLRQAAKLLRISSSALSRKAQKYGLTKFSNPE